MMPVSYESELESSGKIMFTVRGISMRPLFHAGSDAIIVKKCSVESLKNLDIVLFMRPSPDGMQYVLHRIVARRKDGKFIIAGDNCITVDIVPPEAIIGLAVSAQREGRPIKLGGFGYFLYANLWCRPYWLRIFVLKCRNRICSVGGFVIKKIRGR